MALLFDASAVTNLIIHRGKRALVSARGNFALDLTGYEIGNALWRLCLLERKITQEEASRLLASAAGFLNLLGVITLLELDSNRILTVAVSSPISFYDASYITAAETKRLTLVTDDEDLSKAASAYVATKRSTHI